MKKIKANREKQSIFASDQRGVRNCSHAPADGRSRNVSDGNFEEVPSPIHVPERCPGCGVPLQGDNPEGAGYFRRPRPKVQGLGAKKSAGGANAKVESLESYNVNENMDPELLELLKQDLAAAAMTDDKKGVGNEISDSAKDKTPLREVVCVRCFQLSNYGKLSPVSVDSSILQLGNGVKLTRENAVVMCVVDAADFDGSVLRGLDALVRDRGRYGVPVVLVINKTDLVPLVGLTESKWKQWCIMRARQLGLNDIRSAHLVSSKSGAGVEKLLDALEELRTEGSRGRAVYAVGMANAGKSSLINAMARVNGVEGDDGEIIYSAKGLSTEAFIPGTTLSTIERSGILFGNGVLFDTPGVYNRGSITMKLSAVELRSVLPRKPIRLTTFRVPVGSSLFVGGLCRIDYVSGPSTVYLSPFVSGDLPLHLTNTNKASAIWEKLAGDTLRPPESKKRASVLALTHEKRIEFILTDFKKHTQDICIHGLGWIGVAAMHDATRFRVWVPEGVEITTRKAMIPAVARVMETPGLNERR